MFQNNNELSKALADYASITPIPDMLFKDVFAIYDHNLDQYVDWDDFVGGQKTMHTHWTGDYFNGYVLLNSLTYGSSASTYQGFSNINDTMTMITKNIVDLKDKLVALGEDTKRYYFAQSFAIDNTIGQERYKGVVVLKEIQAYLNENFEQEEVGYSQNVVLGYFGVPTTIPKLEYNDINQIIGIKEDTYTPVKPNKMRMVIPGAAGLLGNDLISTKDTIVKTINKLDDISKYCIVPTQFNLWTIDNYGIAHPNDITNQLKAISYNQNVGNTIQSGAQAGQSIGSTTGSTSKVGTLIKAGTSLVSTAMSGANKLFYGDSRSLSSETAISSKFMENENTLLKMFIQPVNKVSEWTTQELISGKSGILETANFGTQLNGNRAANIMQSISGLMDGDAITTLPNPDLIIKEPLNKNGDNQVYKMVGNRLLQNTKNTGKILPWLKAPDATGVFKLTEQDIQNYMDFGVPRKNDSSNKIAPLMQPRDWTMGFRWQGFRPSPYTWINYPIIFPAEIGIYDVINTGNPVEYIGFGGSVASGEKLTQGGSDYWTKGITISQMVNKQVGNNRDAKLEQTITYSDNDVVKHIDLCAITSSDVVIELYKDDELIGTRNFNSSGKRYGNASQWNSRLEL